MAEINELLGALMGALEATEKAVARARTNVRDEEAIREAVREAVSRSLEERGWKKFQFFSSYYGSHPERGGGDEKRIFLFHPRVDISRWSEVSFTHGDRSENDENESFSDWMEDLEEGRDFLEM